MYLSDLFSHVLFFVFPDHGEVKVDKGKPFLLKTNSIKINIFHVQEVPMNRFRNVYWRSR